MSDRYFGKRLKKLREEAGLTRLELSLRCGDLHPSHIGYIESGKKQPTISTLYKLASGLGITISDLVGDGEPQILHDPSMNRLIAYASKFTPEERDNFVAIMKLISQGFKS